VARKFGLGPLCRSLRWLGPPRLPFLLTEGPRAVLSAGRHGWRLVGRAPHPCDMVGSEPGPDVSPTAERSPATLSPMAAVSRGQGPPRWRCAMRVSPTGRWRCRHTVPQPRRHAALPKAGCWVPSGA